MNGGDCDGLTNATRSTERQTSPHSESVEGPEELITGVKTPIALSRRPAGGVPERDETSAVSGVLIGLGFPAISRS
jgi:hypothetical protein